MTHTRTFPETGIWKYTINTALVVLAAATITIASVSQSMAGGGGAPPPPPIWLEDPDPNDNNDIDAGGRGDEQLLTGPIGLEYGGISGDLGTNQERTFVQFVEFLEVQPPKVTFDDIIDVFGFYHAGGNFSATMTFPDIFTIALYDTDYSMPPLAIGNSLFGNLTIPHPVQIGVPNLAPGNYFLELTTVALDPPFSIVTTPIQAFRVSEPAMIAVFAIGLAAMGGLARRRQNKKA